MRVSWDADRHFLRDNLTYVGVVWYEKATVRMLLNERSADQKRQIKMSRCHWANYDVEELKKIYICLYFGFEVIYTCEISNKVVRTQFC